MERKFPVDPRRVEVVAAWLRHTCRPADDYPVGQVTSCYFDTVDWDCYFESVDGDLEKRKVRLRWYDALPAAGRVSAFLEAKEKEGFETWKRRVRLELDASLLAAGRFDEVLPRARLDEALAAAGVFESRDLRPATVISYRRRRFVEPGGRFRLALDSAIQASPARGRVGGPTVRLPLAVVELKGKTLELPLHLRGLHRFAAVWSSHSKYALAIEGLARALGSASP